MVKPPRPPDDPVALLGRAVDATGAIVAGITPDQAALPTPCRSWDVGAVVGHLVNDFAQFAAMTEGASYERRAAVAPDGDWATAYRAGAAHLLETWERRRPLDWTITLFGRELPAEWSVRQQTTEFVLHGWDLARATGQRFGCDEDVGVPLLAWLGENLSPEFRGDEAQGKAFGPAAPVAEDAPLADRIAACAGRDPGWAPPRR